MFLALILLLLLLPLIQLESQRHMTLVDLFLIFATKLHSIRNREYFHIARSRDPHHHRCRYSYKTVRIIHEYMHTYLHAYCPTHQHAHRIWICFYFFHRLFWHNDVMCFLFVLFVSYTDCTNTPTSLIVSTILGSLHEYNPLPKFP